MILELLVALLSTGATLTPTIMQFIAELREQPGMTDEAIITHAKVVNDENTAAIIAERLRLLSEIPSQEGSDQQ